MKLKVQFGFIDSKVINWWKHLDDFPKNIYFLGKKYEWAFYDKDLTGKVDMILTFSEVSIYDPGYKVPCPTWAEVSGEDWSDPCECGSAYSSFPWDHFRFCKKWTKW